MAKKTVMTVEKYLESVDPALRHIIEKLRGAILTSSPDVSEHLKWNAPSFCKGGDDRVTLGVERDGSLRIVLHRGAKVRDSQNFTFHDSSGLAEWPSSDRGVVYLRKIPDIDASLSDIRDLVSRWFEAVGDT